MQKFVKYYEKFPDFSFCSTFSDRSYRNQSTDFPNNLTSRFTPIAYLYDRVKKKGSTFTHKIPCFNLMFFVAELKAVAVHQKERKKNGEKVIRYLTAFVLI